jgi:hypothetical protein
MTTVIFTVNQYRTILIIIDVTESIVTIIMQAAITHSNGDDKDSVYFDWTAPAAGSGALRFRYNIILSYFFRTVILNIALLSVRY